jgi:hypothetical protein
VRRALSLALLLGVAGGCSFPDLRYEASTDASPTSDAPSGSSSGAPPNDSSGGADDAAQDARPEVATVVEAGEGGEAGDPCDKDGDGYADTKCPLGTDCCDEDRRAHPYQTQYYASTDACGSFDYDCSGAAEPQYGAYLTCTGPSAACISLCPSTQCSCGDVSGACAYGFTGADPGCGRTGPWGLCAPSGNGCTPHATTEAMTQYCH